MAQNQGQLVTDPNDSSEWERLISEEKARRARRAADRQSGALTAGQGPALESVSLEPARNPSFELLHKLLSGFGIVLSVDLDPDSSDTDVARAALEAVRSLTPHQALSMLMRAESAGIPALSSRHSAMADAYIRRRAYPLPLLANKLSPTWEVLAALENKKATITAGSQISIARSMPLELLDDLVDRGQLQIAPAEGSVPNATYLRARLAPQQLTDVELDSLEWHDEQERRRLVSGEPVLGCGEQNSRWTFLAALRDARQPPAGFDPTGLVGKERELYAALTTPTRLMAEANDWGEDKTLWIVLDRALERSPSTGHQEFQVWRQVRFMIDAVRRAEFADTHGYAEHARKWRRGAQEQANLLIRGHNPKRPLRAQHWEAKNVLAYFKFLDSRSRHDCESAATELTTPEGSDPSKDFSWNGRQAIERNLSGLQAAAPSSAMPNPYFVLGVHHRSPGWKSQWLKLRMNLNDDGKVKVNHAKDSIEQFERGQIFQPHELPPSLFIFQVPLDPARWRNAPAANDGMLKPRAVPYPRRTVRANAGAIDLLWESIASEIMAEVNGNDPNSASTGDGR